MKAQWIEFALTPDQPPKTQKWCVVATHGAQETLGYVKWWGAWRKYAFFPLAATLYETTCLRDIATFCEERTLEQRAKTRPPAPAATA